MTAEEIPRQLNSERTFEDLFKFAFDPERWRILSAIRTVADYDIPEDHQAVFMRFHQFITHPQPAYVAAWRSSERTELWYHRHVNGVLGDVRTGLAAAHYHADRLADIEQQVTKILAESQRCERMENGFVMGIGGTRRMDLEYQAFILSYRRCLDYLAGSLASYFMTECSSFRKMPRTINKTARTGFEGVAAAISTAHSRHANNLAFVLDEGRSSVRNQVAHYSAVPAGMFNLNSQGFYLVGGGEKLGIPKREPLTTLSAVLSTRLGQLHACLVDMIDSFIEAARQNEKPF